MSIYVVLDTGPLGLITHPRGTDENRRCVAWIHSLTEVGVEFGIPEICDYELRREYVRHRSYSAIANLNRLAEMAEYLALNTSVMHEAAGLWAEARNTGLPTASADALDADVILSAQALQTQAYYPSRRLIVATTNVGHLSRYLEAKLWQDITPDLNTDEPE